MQVKVQQIISVLTATLTPKKILDINGDGVVDINDSLDATRINDATIAGSGITLGAGGNPSQA